MERIPLFKGSEVVAHAKVDAADYERLSARRWVLSQYGYAIRYPTKRADGFNRSIIFMHREILNLPVGSDVHTDHLNHDRLDNRRSNLRPCSLAENNRNTSSRRGASSEYRGVLLAPTKRRRAWYASVRGEYLGTFDSELDAALAAAARRKELWPHSHEPLLETERPAFAGRADATTASISTA